MQSLLSGVLKRRIVTGGDFFGVQWAEDRQQHSRLVAGTCMHHRDKPGQSTRGPSELVDADLRAGSDCIWRFADCPTDIES
jgi:hypothetical protein